MRYRAFFSYARADDRIANWLHRQLDGYRTPKALVGTDGELGPVPAKLHPIFRDRTDLESGGHVDSALQNALEDSETLIVLCTPTSAKSRWVNHEVETFLNGGREAMIFPVIAAGLPDSGDPETECFPPALRGKGLLAADLREIKLPTGQLVGDGREGGRLKLIAGLLGVKLDALVQRERRRQRQTVAVLATAAVAFAALTVAAIGLGLLAQRNAVTAQTSEARAYNSRARIFAERAREQLSRKNYALAARYLLAGWKSAPANEMEYRAGLSVLMQTMQGGRIVADNGADIVHTELSPDGKLALTFAERGAELWSTADVKPVGGLNLKEQNGWVNTIPFGSFSPSGSRFVVGAYGAKVQLWDANTQRPIGTLVQATAVSFSPDGARIATAGDGVHLWDGKTGQLEGALFTARAQSAVFSPDNRRLSTVVATLGRGSGAYTNTIQIWDVALRRPLSNFAVDGSIQPVGVAFSPDSKLLVTAQSKEPHVFDVETGRMIAMLRGHSGAVRQARFSRDGRKILTAPYHGAARLWDARSGQLLAVMGGRDRVDDRYAAKVAAERTAEAMRDPHRFDGEVGESFTQEESRTLQEDERPDGRMTIRADGNMWDMDSAELSPDQTRVITYGQYNAAHLWDAATGRKIVALPHDDWVRSATFSPDGDRLLTAAWDNTARVWDGHTGAVRAVLVGHQDGVNEALFAANGVDVITGSKDGTARFWPAPGMREVSLRSTGRAFSRAVFALGGDRIVTEESIQDSAELREDHRRDNRSVGAVRVWSGSGQPMTPLSGPGGGDLRIAAVSPVGPFVIMIGASGAQIWDIDRGVAIATLASRSARVKSAAFSSDGSRIALGLNPVGVLICDRVPERCVWKLDSEQSLVGTGSFSSDGKRFVGLSMSGEVRVWNMMDGTILLRLVQDQTLFADVARFSSDGERIAAASGNGAAALWDANSGKPIAVVGGKDRAYLNDLQISPDARLVIGIAGGGVHVTDFGAQKEVALLRHRFQINSATFSPDGRLIATASDDETARVWDAATGRQLAEFKHDNRVPDAMFDPRGVRLLTYAEDGSARVWDIHRLGQPMPVLARDACSSLLGRSGLVFSDSEIGADRMIKDVWLVRGRSAVDRVC